MTATITKPAEETAAEDAAPVLEVRGLRKEFPGTLALDDVSLEVRRGEIHALLGENGAGKSTMIKCICGAYSSTAGEVLIEGKPVSFSDPRGALAAGIAVVHQHFNLVPTLNVAENLWLGETLPRRFGLVDWPRVHARARAALKYVGIDIPTGAWLQKLRADQLAMISIAKAIASNAKIIILDEPTTALLPDEVDTLFAQMRRLSSEGHSFLYVSHRLAEVFAIADRATVLRDGKNAGTFARDSMSREQVIEAIVGRRGPLAGRKTSTLARDSIALQAEALSGGGAREVSLTLRHGEILGVAGLPGSGAEDVLSLLFGRIRRRGGIVRMGDSELRLRSPAEAIGAGIAFVPADRLAESIFHAEPVRTNITMPSLSRYVRNPILRLINRRAEAREGRAVVERMRVRTPGIETKIDDLSGGNQQKVVLGRWLSTGARVFLLNAPTAAVDVGAKTEIYALIEELASEGAGILFASTELEEYPLICDRVLVFFRGQVVGELRGEQLTERNIMTLAAGEKLQNGDK